METVFIKGQKPRNMNKQVLFKSVKACSAISDPFEFLKIPSEEVACEEDA